MMRTSTINIDKVAFPSRSREAFIAFTGWHKQNPYTITPHEFKSLGEDLGKEMRVLLANTRFQKSDGAKILRHWESVANGDPSSTLLIENFPSDPADKLRASPTAASYGYTEECIGKQGYIAEYALLAANTLSGQIILRTPGAHDGLPFHHLAPKKGMEDVQSGVGARRFPWHTEDAWMPDNDMYVSLLCIRNTTTPTLIASENDVYNQLKNSLTSVELKKLEEPVFGFSSLYAVDSVIPFVTTKPIIIRDTNDQITKMNINCNTEKMFAADPDDKLTQAIVGKVIRSLNTLDRGVILTPNDCLSFDNRITLHTRSEIPPQDLQSGKERHLIRTQGIPEPIIIPEL